MTYWYFGGSATTSAIVLVGSAGRADSNGDLDFGPPLAAAAGLTTTTMVSLNPIFRSVTFLVAFGVVSVAPRTGW